MHFALRITCQTVISRHKLVSYQIMDTNNLLNCHQFSTCEVHSLCRYNRAEWLMYLVQLNDYCTLQDPKSCIIPCLTD